MRTSSTSEGRIFRVFRPSEKRSRTLVRPFMKEIFSSRVFEAKVDLSRKFKVEIDNDEKNGYVGNDDGVGLLSGCRVTREASNADSREREINNT